jgi:hypothetical protein
MRRALAVAATLAVTLAGPSTAGADVSVTVDRTGVATGLGKRFSFRSTFANPGPGEIRGLVAHLNIASLRPDVYVDPEDWSTQRTQYPSAVPPHATTRLSWSVHAVTTGRLVLYVSLVSATGQAVAAGPALHAEVGAQQRLDPNGVLPVALGVPVLLLALLAAARLRRRRLV